MKYFLVLLLTVLSTWAGMPQLKSLRATWAPYDPPPYCSNVVIVIYKSTSLGTVWSPFKPAAITPANRTNTSISVLPGTYRFYSTAKGQPLPESRPSNTVTNRVNP